MSEDKTYRGSCHCGAVSYEVTMPPPAEAVSCNCSICSRAGWLLAFAPASSFQLLSGEDALGDYQFARKSTHHLFCTTCGVRSFSRGNGPDGSVMVGINLRCLADFDWAAIPVQTFDGASL
ncbi:MAG: GFA family protein [Labilithrix sp.]|nr:GFA family protein [Labilithrix sp.]MCW5818210.1 GFA family protein [Labilithrix sp.]